MKDRLQKRLQSLLAAYLPGARVECRYASNHTIDVFVLLPKTKAGMRTTGVPLRSLIGPGALDVVAEELLI